MDPSPATDRHYDDAPLTPGLHPVALVADDDDDMRALVASALRLDGYAVIEARNGSEALRLVGNPPMTPDIIVTDIRMPDLGGIALLAGLRDAGWMTPIVVISAFVTDQVRFVADQFGADAIFSKPVDLDDLRTVVMLLCPSGPRPFATRAV